MATPPYAVGTQALAWQGVGNFDLSDSAKSWPRTGGVVAQADEAAIIVLDYNWNSEFDEVTQQGKEGETLGIGVAERTGVLTLTILAGGGAAANNTIAYARSLLFPVPLSILVLENMDNADLNGEFMVAPGGGWGNSGRRFKQGTINLRRYSATNDLETWRTISPMT